MPLDNSLYKIDLKIYYTDFLITSFIFLASFIALLYINNNISFILTFLVSVISLYRAGAFIHEITHQHSKSKFKLFKNIFDYTIGLFILYPALRFKQPHLQHHKIGVFGTEEDPQYVLLNKSENCFKIFTLLPLLTPIQNLLVVLFSPIRFLPAAAVVYNNLEATVYSDIKFTKSERIRLNKLERFYFLSILVSLLFVDLKFYFLWYLVSVASWSLSTVRIPLEHSLTKYNKESTNRTQLVDSYTFESNPLFAFIVQPLGLRYHTAHHLYPAVPYHNLKKLHKVLKEKLGEEYLKQSF